MSPTLHDGQMVFASRLSYVFRNPKIGEIVTAKINGKTFFKRIIKKDGERLFLSGDNEKDSFDSRKLGLISKKEIIGKIII